MRAAPAARRVEVRLACAFILKAQSGLQVTNRYHCAKKAMKKRRKCTNECDAIGGVEAEESACM